MISRQTGQTEPQHGLHLQDAPRSIGDLVTLDTRAAYPVERVPVSIGQSYRSELCSQVERMEGDQWAS